MQLDPKDGEFIAAGEGLEPHDSNPVSVEQDVMAAMEKAQKAAEEPPAEEGAEQPAEQPEGDKPLDFNKAKDDTTPLKEGDSGAEGASGEVPAEEPGSEQVAGELEPPPEWSADDQGIFRSVPQDVQQWLLDRHNGTMAQVTQSLEAVAPLQRVQQQWQPYLDKRGVPMEQAVGRLFETEMLLSTGTPEQKRQTILSLIQNYGVELEQRPLVPDELSNDPVASAITPQLQSVMQNLQSLQSQMDQKFGQMQTAQQNQQEAALQSFADQTDEKGAKLHPYFNEVRGLMEVLASQAQAAGTATTIEEVYRQACRASPTVWPKIQAAERSADLRERQKAAAEKQRAASSVSSSPSAARSMKDNGKSNETVYDTVLRAMSAHSGGA